MTEQFLDTLYKHVKYGGAFFHNSIQYTKASHKRGYYWFNGRKVFRNFRQSTKVKVEPTYYYI